jgi:hypothetical protein
MSRFATTNKSLLSKLFVLVAVVIINLGATQTAAAQAEETTFELFPNPVTLNCLRASPDVEPTAKATVLRGRLNDVLFLDLDGIKPGLAFDLFTVENSNQTANGDPVAGFQNFGLAWYQSDIEINKHQTSGHVRIKTILLDQIFGFDPAVGLAPTNTFHVGFWFNDPQDAANCVNPANFTPFNGEHHAGPLAMISRPVPDTNLGPLCTNPDTSKNPAVCNP